MRTNKLFYISTSLTALFLAVFTIGSTNQSIVTPDKSNTSEPTVVSTSPSDGDSDVARNVVIEITFSEEMDSTSMNNTTFTLMNGSESVTGSLEFSGNRGTFTSDRSLKAESEYTASVTMTNNHADHDIMDDESDDSYHAENGTTWSFTTGGTSGSLETVDLGKAAGYVMLSNASIHNDESSNVTGKKGFDPDFKRTDENKTAYWVKDEDVNKETTRRDTTRNRSDYRDDSATDTTSSADNMEEAFADMMAAYTNASERSPVDFVDFKFKKSDHKDESADKYYGVDYDRSDKKDSTETGKKDRTDYDLNDDESWAVEDSNDVSVTLDPGVYKWSEAVEISSNITLAGSADDIWIFQIADGLTLNRDVEITLRDGAVAEHVFWQVAGDVNLEESSHFEGIILSKSGITMKSGASLNGRMLVENDITLDENTIIEPVSTASVQRTRTND